MMSALQEETDRDMRTARSVSCLRNQSRVRSYGSRSFVAQLVPSFLICADNR